MVACACGWDPKWQRGGGRRRQRDASPRPGDRARASLRTRPRRPVQSVRRASRISRPLRCGSARRPGSRVSTISFVGPRPPSRRQSGLPCAAAAAGADADDEETAARGERRRRRSTKKQKRTTAGGRSTTTTNGANARKFCHDSATILPRICHRSAVLSATVLPRFCRDSAVVRPFSDCVLRCSAVVLPLFCRSLPRANQCRVGTLSADDTRPARYHSLRNSWVLQPYQILYLLSPHYEFLEETGCDTAKAPTIVKELGLP